MGRLRYGLKLNQDTLSSSSWRPSSFKGHFKKKWKLSEASTKQTIRRKSDIITNEYWSENLHPSFPEKYIQDNPPVKMFIETSWLNFDLFDLQTEYSFDLVHLGKNENFFILHFITFSVESTEKKGNRDLILHFLFLKHLE